MARRVDLFKLLDGLITVYKPPNMVLDKFLGMIKKQLAADFNALTCEPKLVRTILRLDERQCNKLTLVSVPDIVDDELVLGKRFVAGDFVLHPVDPLDEMTSGLQVLGIGENGVCNHATQFAHSFWLKTYHLNGMFGRASSSGTASGATLLRASWRHVTRYKLDRVLVDLQTQFRRLALHHAGLRPNTQTAYLALAARGTGSDLRPVTPAAVGMDFEDREQLISPWEHSPPPYSTPFVNVAGEFAVGNEAERRQSAPYVNSIRCAVFDPPFFTLEIQVAYETLDFLVNLVANIGPKLRTATLLSSARRVRHGRLTLEDALLMKQCTVPEQVLQSLSNYVAKELKGVEVPLDEMELLGLLAGSTTTPNVFTNLFTCSKLHPFEERPPTEEECRLLTSIK
ncbi:hypothetical protein CRM22_008443 [Opisthorchis felineus]|uniref:Pseudouridine synthase II N-terminal domain-containing protein n=1 Tax=Opisthorchis felineus TaxID=147828 RepID=A0A4S2LBP8_OPIFE|nr:hypothetical protein CRM22_008443 [Opisthorchis felineus]